MTAVSAHADPRERVPMRGDRFDVSDTEGHPVAARCVMVFMGVALTAQAALGADARSISPAWSWGAQVFSSAFKIDTTACTMIRVPIADTLVDVQANGESCPGNMVMHGYFFNQRVTQTPTTPRYTHRSGRCGMRPASSTVFHPVTGEGFPRVRNVRSELCANRTRMYEWDEFLDWNYVVERTVDPDHLYQRCCPSAN